MPNVTDSSSFILTINTATNTQAWCRGCGCMFSWGPTSSLKAACSRVSSTASAETATSTTAAAAAAAAGQSDVYPLYGAVSTVQSLAPSPPSGSGANGAASTNSSAADKPLDTIVTDTAVMQLVSVDSDSIKWNVSGLTAGAYALRLNLSLSCLGGQTVVVDSVGPRAYGRLQRLDDARGAAWPGHSEPVLAAATQSDVLLLLQLNFTQALAGFSLSALQLQGATPLRLDAVDNRTYRVWAMGTAGTIAVMTLPSSAYHNSFGQQGQNDVVTTLALTALDADVEGGIKGLSIASGVLLGAALVGSPFSLHMSGGLMQSAYHIQLLAMSANLASPGVIEDYRRIARYFRWSLLAVKGYLPIFGQPSSDTNPSPLLNTSGAAPPPLAPPSTSTRTLSQWDVPSHPVSSYPAAFSTPLYLSSQLPSSSSSSLGPLHALLPSQPDLYLDLPGISSRSLLTPDPSDNSNTNSTLSTWQYNSAEEQDLVYTLAIAGILFCAILVLHLVAYLGFRLFTSEPPAVLTTPFLEVTFGALLLMGVAFYACLQLSSWEQVLWLPGPDGSEGPGSGASISLSRDDDFQHSAALALLVIFLLPFLFAAFLWWLTLGRIFRGGPGTQQRVVEHMVTHSNLLQDTALQAQVRSQQLDNAVHHAAVHAGGAEPENAPGGRRPDRNTRERQASAEEIFDALHGQASRPDDASAAAADEDELQSSSRENSINVAGVMRDARKSSFAALLLGPHWHTRPKPARSSIVDARPSNLGTRPPRKLPPITSTSPAGAWNTMTGGGVVQQSKGSFIEGPHWHTRETRKQRLEGEGPSVLSHNNMWGASVANGDAQVLNPEGNEDVVTGPLVPGEHVRDAAALGEDEMAGAGSAAYRSRLSLLRMSCPGGVEARGPEGGAAVEEAAAAAAAAQLQNQLPMGSRMGKRGVAAMDPPPLAADLDEDDGAAAGKARPSSANDTPTARPGSVGAPGGAAAVPKLQKLLRPMSYGGEVNAENLEQVVCWSIRHYTADTAAAQQYGIQIDGPCPSPSPADAPAPGERASVGPGPEPAQPENKNWTAHKKWWSRVVQSQSRALRNSQALESSAVMPFRVSGLQPVQPPPPVDEESPRERRSDPINDFHPKVNPAFVARSSASPKHGSTDVLPFDDPAAAAAAAERQASDPSGNDEFHPRANAAFGAKGEAGSSKHGSTAVVPFNTKPLVGAARPSFWNKPDAGAFLAGEITPHHPRQLPPLSQQYTANAPSIPHFKLLQLDIDGKEIDPVQPQPAPSRLPSRARSQPGSRSSSAGAPGHRSGSQSGALDGNVHLEGSGREQHNSGGQQLHQSSAWVTTTTTTMQTVTYTAGASGWRCWDQFLPSAAFLKHFEFLFEDAIGTDAETKLQRSQWYRLIATALNFTHKALCAAVIGSYGLLLLSWPQLALLLCLQVFMLGYLALATPYLHWQLMTVEVVCHLCHACMVALALSLAHFVSASATNWGLVACLVVVVLVVMGYELWVLFQQLRAAWVWWRARKGGKKEGYRAN